MSTPSPRRAGIYARISSDPSGTALGVTRQRQDARALAESKGWLVIDEYVDNDVSASGYSRKPRVEYERMLADIESGRIDAIATWALDRLYRRPLDLEYLIPLVEERGIALATVGGDHDLSTRGGLLHARIMGAVAADESRAKSDRQRRANVQRRERGLTSNGGNRSFGYSRAGEIDSVEAAVVRGMFTDFLAGVSIREITKRLNASGVATVKGGPWREPSVRGILLSARVAGLVEHRGAIVSRGQWESIVSEDTWRAARAALTDPKRRTTPGSGRRYLLSGIMLCGKAGCDAPVYGRPRAHGRSPAYQCKANHYSRDMDRSDKYVKSLVVERLARADAAELLSERVRDDVGALRAEADRLRERRDQLAALAADPDGMTLSQFKTANARLAERLAVVEGSLASAGRRDMLSALVVPGDASEADARWRELTLTQQKKVIRHLAERITVVGIGSGSPRRDVVGIEVTWRHDLG